MIALPDFANTNVVFEPFTYPVAGVPPNPSPPPVKTKGNGLNLCFSQIANHHGIHQQYYLSSSNGHCFLHFC